MVRPIVFNGSVKIDESVDKYDIKRVGDSDSLSNIKEKDIIRNAEESERNISNLSIETMNNGLMKSEKKVVHHHPPVGSRSNNSNNYNDNIYNCNYNNNATDESRGKKYRLRQTTIDVTLNTGSNILSISSSGNVKSEHRKDNNEGNSLFYSNKCKKVHYSENSSNDVKKQRKSRLNEGCEGEKMEVHEKVNEEDEDEHEDEDEDEHEDEHEEEKDKDEHKEEGGMQNNKCNEYFDRDNNVRAGSNPEIVKKQISDISNNIYNILLASNIPKNDILKRTYRRFAKTFLFLTEGYIADIEKLIEKSIYKRKYKNKSVIKITSIRVYSLCKHHLLPFEGNCDIEYVPNKYILGLSKFSRIVDVFSRRLQLQEDLTNDICSALKKYLKPLSIHVTIVAKHMCVSMRGVKEHDARTVTQAYYQSKNSTNVKNVNINNSAKKESNATCDDITKEN
ncbi:GTP cyclohydrolase I, putative [Plasmodium malariae]|uniref:GTP cyclohydrolase 1 n=1 Tax=Plasmodium malariae TaxID=5858 RepID=A0A1A8XAI2_PLAMA|nr:GTP cyclohydrolase I, putative [Plasmodium malariae]SBT00832.1 GTP cyclohydrolase I (GCH1) [Plasmodium malariae]SCP03523.1 GTP cyclohydrolase I, putative [Plasmodium malariae]